MKDIVILGAGDFGKEVAWLIEEINKETPTYRILGFLDDNEEKIGQKIIGYKCLGSISFLEELKQNCSLNAVIACQNGEIRKNFVEMFPDFKNWETLVHPSVNIAECSKLGKGTIICAGGNISVNSTIGDFCILIYAVTVGHDCIIGDYNTIMSGAVVSGHVHISDGATLGTNCTIVPGMVIGKHSKVGAGSVVLRNVKDDVTVMGVPAKIVQF